MSEKKRCDCDMCLKARADGASAVAEYETRQQALATVTTPTEDALRASLATLRAQLLAAEARAVKAEGDRGNLLAIIHRDGGHHAARVGDERAVEDAHELIANERVRANDAFAGWEKAEAARDEALGALAALREVVVTYRALTTDRATPPHVKETVMLGLANALAAPATALARLYTARVRAEAMRECAGVVEAYRETKPKPQPVDPDVHPSQAGPLAFDRGCALGERSALYSASLRLRSLADEAAKGGER